VVFLMSTVGSPWVDSIPNKLIGLAQFPEAGSFAVGDRVP
jgi:hypothetical protein